MGKKVYKKGEIYKAIIDAEELQFDLYLLIAAVSKDGKEQYILPFLGVQRKFSDPFGHCVYFNHSRVVAILEAAYWGRIAPNRKKYRTIKKLVGPVAIVDADKIWKKITTKPYYQYQKSDVDESYTGVVNWTQKSLLPYTMYRIVEESLEFSKSESE